MPPVKLTLLVNLNPHKNTNISREMFPFYVLFIWAVLASIYKQPETQAAGIDQMSRIHPFNASTDSLHDKQNSSDMCNDYRHIGNRAGRPTVFGRVCGATHVTHHASNPSSSRPQRDRHHSNCEDSAEDQDKHCKANAKVCGFPTDHFEDVFPHCQRDSFIHQGVVWRAATLPQAFQSH